MYNTAGNGPPAPPGRTTRTRTAPGGRTDGDPLVIHRNADGLVLNFIDGFAIRLGAEIIEVGRQVGGLHERLGGGF